MTANEVAEALGVSLRTIQRYHRLGAGPARVKIPGAKRALYRASDLAAWLERNLEPAGPRSGSNVR